MYIVSIGSWSNCEELRPQLIGRFLGKVLSGVNGNIKSMHNQNSNASCNSQGVGILKIDVQGGWIQVMRTDGKLYSAGISSIQ